LKGTILKKLDADFYLENADILAQKLLGKTLVRVFDDGTMKRYTISITEAYVGSDDKACHASKGRTARTEIMFHEGGKVYVYLIYGMHWMLNVVSGRENDPQAVLICGLDSIKGSGRVGKELQMDKSFYGEDLTTSKRIWIEVAPECQNFFTSTRMGVDYAGEWKDKLWRFEIRNK